MEILDSRDNPIIRLRVGPDGGTRNDTSVPSTGEDEALELRDGDATRDGSEGVMVAPTRLGQDPPHQADMVVAPAAAQARGS